MERELFDLDILVGNWESINLNPTVMIHRNAESHQLSIIYMNEATKQASPVTYEIQEDEQGYFVYFNGKRASISYCQRLDMLTIALSLIHISEPTRPEPISYAVFCLKKFFFNDTATTEIYTLEFVGSVRCV